MFLAILITLVAGYALWTWICLELNVQKARRMGIPCVRLPINSTNVLWMIIEPNVWRIIDALPIPWLSYPESFRYLRRGWPFYEKAAAHERHGPIWALVSPVRIDVYLADSEAIGNVFARRKDFARPSENYKILDVFGPNITSADNDNWPRHRKALAAPFNESIMSMVWAETSKQAQAVSRIWTKFGSSTAGITSVQKDVRQVSLNTLAAVGFGRSYDFSENGTDDSDYRSTLQTVLDNAILLMLVPYNVLTMPGMPETWLRIGKAGDAFRRHMSEMLEAESTAIKTGEKGTRGVIASLVHALDVSQPKAATKGLSKEELYGNTFVINFAGHDTTANTLTFAIYLLAANPSIQQWISEEIQQATSNSNDQTYESLFPNLPRCRAVLYETLRMFPTSFLIPKGTTTSPQTLQVQDQTITIPPRTGVMLNMYACHHHPTIFPEPLKWKPSRWINDDGTFFNPPRNTYFPWSDGPQNCPGKKFAEVEIVAILACLFRDHRIRVKKLEGEGGEAALERLNKTINDVDFQVLLRMRDADQVRFVYEKV